MIPAGLVRALGLTLIPLAVAPAAEAPAEQPPISNARLATASAAGGLEPAVQAAIGQAERARLDRLDRGQGPGRRAGLLLRR